MMGNGSGMYFGGGLMWLFWILVILALVWLGAALVRGSSGRKSKSALEILDERFARGEIDREEFEKMRETLRRP
jgi:putative membrane protein